MIAPIDAPTASTLSGKVVVSDPNDLQAFTTPTASTTTSKGAKKPWELAVEEPVDTYWEERDGKIERAKGMGGCVCGSKSMCDYCMPLEVRLVYRGARADGMVAVRPQLPEREQDQASVVPLVPPQDPRQRSSFLAIDVLHPAAVEPLVRRAGAVLVWLAPLVASRDLHQVPAVRRDALATNVPHGGPRRVCAGRDH